MQEAIEILPKQPYYIIAINGDNITYIPLLKIMSDMSPYHIFVLVSDFTLEKQNEAFINGASGCAPFQDDPDKNVESALAYLQSLNARGKPKRTPKTVNCDNLTIFYDSYQVFCNDKEVDFTKLEYDLLYYFLVNRNLKLTFTMLSRKVWKEEAVLPGTMWQIINKLRLKLDEYEFTGGIIESLRGVGYRFTTRTD